MKKVNYVLDVDIQSFFDKLDKALGNPIHRASRSRPPHPEPDPEMAQGRGA
jgi:hypothetical protein